MRNSGRILTRVAAVAALAAGLIAVMLDATTLHAQIMSRSAGPGSARGAGRGPSRVSPGESAPPEVAALAANNCEFAFDLYRKLSRQQGNLLFSPYSISAALAMTYSGAKGETAEQMAKALHFTQPQDVLHPAFAKLTERLAGLETSQTISRLPKLSAGTQLTPQLESSRALTEKRLGFGTVKLRIANSLWPQEDFPFRPEFVAAGVENYDVTTHAVNYKVAAEHARQQINKWVEDRTENKITNLIPEGVLDRFTRLVLVNAIYFYADWQQVFEASKTRNEPFHLDATRSASAPLMNQAPKTFDYTETDDAQILRLDYIGRELSMLVLLPKKVDGLENLEAELSAANLKGWLGKLQGQRVNVFLPKFKMEAQFQLAETLKAMGIVDGFKDGLADFTGMGGRLHELFITAAIHKAYIAVDEKGTEAAAATAIGMGSGGRAPVTVEFRADHPFVFMIQDNQTGSILFLGRVADPTAAAK